MNVSYKIISSHFLILQLFSTHPLPPKLAIDRVESMHSLLQPILYIKLINRVPVIEIELELTIINLQQSLMQANNIFAGSIQH